MSEHLNQSQENSVKPVAPGVDAPLYSDDQLRYINYWVKRVSRGDPDRAVVLYQRAYRDPMLIDLFTYSPRRVLAISAPLLSRENDHKD